MRNIYEPTHQSESLVLEKIINLSEVSRTDLTEYTRLTKSSISDITKSLLLKDIIKETKIGSVGRKGGRKPIYLTFNPQAGIALGVEIGNDFIQGFAAFLNGKIINSAIISETISEENVIKLLIEIIDQLSVDLPQTTYGIIGVTIAIPGTVNGNKIIFTPYIDIESVDIVGALNLNYEFPIFLLNEANAGALGEYTFTSASQNLINININEGVGAGIIEKGILFTGRHGKAGEIGHSILIPDGRPCPCGNLGCLEQYASTKQLLRNLKIHEDLPENEFINTIKNRWAIEDEDTITLLEENAKYLSISINNMINFYDPEVIIINSPIYREFPILIDTINSNLKSRNSKRVIIKNSTLNGTSSIYGCIAHTVQTFFDLQNIKL